jgi:predicted nuclease of predicted toxin-antitoxin system
MRFLLDENVDYRLVSFLLKRGYDVTSVAKDYLYGVADEDVLAMATQEHRILITNDKDFGELIVRRHFPHRGVLLFRLKDESLVNVQTRLQHVLAHYHDQLHHFIVITQTRIRIREAIKQTAA